jgi:HPt (histidine-containing phosphotransfer) domain-containing protein
LRKEIIELLLHDENSSISSVEEAFATKNNETIYQKIHYLKGSFNYMKMTRMVSIAIEILELLNEDKLSEALALEGTFLANYQVLRDTLKDYLKSI